MADQLLCTLISASEKASKIARLCRENKELFSLLIQEKGERNNEIDFKTLADVFIQQIVIKEVTSKFGALGQRVQGEEDNLFTNPLGETISIEISSDAENTANLLSKILQQNTSAAKILANAAHETTSTDIDSVADSESFQAICSSGMNLDNIGMWVDPIDCTSQYVLGIEDALPTPSGVYKSGLQCVLVLIGVYDLHSGAPVMGVINQPFHKCEEIDGAKKGNITYIRAQRLGRIVVLSSRGSDSRKIDLVGTLMALMIAKQSKNIAVVSILLGCDKSPRRIDARYHGGGLRCRILVTGGDVIVKHLLTDCEETNEVVSTSISKRVKQLAVISLHDPPATATVDEMPETMEKCASRGAGYKCLTVIDGSSDIFLYTCDGSYKWDTCAPHAILLSIGGGMAVLQDAIKMHEETAPSDDKDIRTFFSKCQVNYKEPACTEGKNWKANCGGIIVYNSTSSSINTANKVLDRFNKTVLKLR